MCVCVCVTILYLWCPLGFKIESITIQMNEGGRQTGEAYVIFLSSSEAERSLDKHKERMGSRSVQCSI